MQESPIRLNIIIFIIVSCKYIFLFWSLYFCQLTAIYCNLLATPLFKSQTVQFIAGGWEVWKQCEAKSCPHQKWLPTLPLDWRKLRRERKLSKCFYSCQIDDDDDDEDSDGSKVWDNLRQKLVPKENKVVSKNLEKAYIQLAAERNPFLVAGHMIVCKLSDLVVSFSMSFGSNDCIIMNALQKRNYLVLLFFGSI